MVQFIYTHADQDGLAFNPNGIVIDIEVNAVLFLFSVVVLAGLSLFGDVVLARLVLFSVVVLAKVLAGLVLFDIIPFDVFSIVDFVLISSEKSRNCGF